mgnify:CR=1 FL=1
MTFHHLPSERMRHCVLEFVARVLRPRGTFVLLGRSKPFDEPAWAASVADMGKPLEKAALAFLKAEFAAVPVLAGLGDVKESLPPRALGPDPYGVACAAHLFESHVARARRPLLLGCGRGSCAESSTRVECVCSPLAADFRAV